MALGFNPGDVSWNCRALQPALDHPLTPGRPEMGQERIRGACSVENWIMEMEHGAAAVPNNGAREVASSTTTTPEAFARTT